MGDFYNTRQMGNNMRTIIIDSKNALTSTDGAQQCEFSVKLSEQVNITAPSDVYLSSIFIGGYKMNQSMNSYYDDNIRYDPSGIVIDGDGEPEYIDADKDIVMYFSIGIPEFDINQVGGEHSNGHDAPYASTNRRLNLVVEDPSLAKLPGQLATSDFKPFILGNLGKNAVYVSTINPKNIDRLTVNIQDQDGASIYAEQPDAATQVFSNPPAASRRVIMQFLIVEKACP